MGTVRGAGPSWHGHPGHHRLPYLNTTEGPGHCLGGQGRAGAPVHPPLGPDAPAPGALGTRHLPPWPAWRPLDQPRWPPAEGPLAANPTALAELSQAGSEAEVPPEHPGRLQVPGEAVLAWPQLSQPRCPRWGTGRPSTGLHHLALPKGQTQPPTRAAGRQGDTGGPAPWGEAPGRPSPRHIQPQGQSQKSHSSTRPT